MPVRPSLPVAGQPQPERADAARNRQKIIEVAARLIDEKGAEQLSLDEVARAAGVGVGTVYRRFGDRCGLLRALIDEHERRFQAAFMNGPPPLGPGAPPAQRITAFLHGLVDRIDQQQALFLALEKGGSGARYGGPYRVYRVHLATLIAQARPGAAAGFLADALLAPVNANLLCHQRDERGMTTEDIKNGLTDLATAVTSHHP
uniref:TetR/AcrR family transcriptional regulator n=1 Tax=Nonomuraea pusilla TaxID=46177 RepID=UPI0006E120B6|nr:TetR/AcrR family transcriptional regulator [Nonomuraea pusilla]